MFMKYMKKSLERFNFYKYPTKRLRSKRRSSPRIFQVVSSLSTKVLLLLWHYMIELAQTVQDYIHELTLIKYEKNINILITRNRQNNKTAQPHH
jgi:hypothetical protein